MEWCGEEAFQGFFCEEGEVGDKVGRPVVIEAGRIQTRVFKRIGVTASVLKAERTIPWDSEELKRLVRWGHRTGGQDGGGGCQLFSSSKAATLLPRPSYYTPAEVLNNPARPPPRERRGLQM